MKRRLTRRKFLEVTALSLGAAAAGSPGRGKQKERSRVRIVTDGNDPVASAAPVVWAIRELTLALERQGLSVAIEGSAAREKSRARQEPNAAGAGFCIIAAGSRTPLALSLLKQAGATISDAAESLALVLANYQGKPQLLACGSDARGLMYALLELSDQLNNLGGHTSTQRHDSEAIEALAAQKATVEAPLNSVRAIGRLFASEVEDKLWFYDREMWPAYFSMLATQRFNRFHLGLGLGYDFLRNVTDAYFLFAYPFFLPVPGYSVRVANLPDAERDRNLEMLQFISSQAVAHGIDFQLGIWTHGYQWIDSPRANYTIEGLSAAEHAAYSRDALAALLKACPNISGVTLRTHGESGVREGSYQFWKTVFEGVAKSEREVKIDLHTKGLDQQLLDAALGTGMPVNISPKYWAEHMGMPYHQAAIREVEMPRENPKTDGFFGLSSGSRSFTRYGYADFLADSPGKKRRAYSVMYRVWPGTTRFLLTGDPVFAAGNARAFQFGGARGGEFLEPLSFKGRRGSGIAGGRCAYADSSLNPRWDWEKYLYTYRVWGRLLYNPDANPETWRRYLRRQFQTSGAPLGSALASASRILPIVTTAHLPSAANETFHPEFYTNQQIVDHGKPYIYSDTPSPKVFGNVSPLDPQLFSPPSDFAGELLKEVEGERSGKYSPVEVAQWLEDLAENAAKRLLETGRNPASQSSPEFRRMAVDIRILSGLGKFFGKKLRAGTLFAIYEQSGERIALEEALKTYRGAREIWAQFAEEAKRVYVSDISIGTEPHQRGHWLDRLAAIDADIAQMAKRLELTAQGGEGTARVRAAVEEVLGRPKRSPAAVHHTVPAQFRAGQPLEIAFAIREGPRANSAQLYYRHVNQAERYESVQMQHSSGEFRAVIPGSYTASHYPLQYYFELRQVGGKASLYPGFTAELTGQPYFVVHGG